MAPRAGAGASQHLPDPDLGAWHQPGFGADGGHAGGGGQVDGGRRHRPRRFPRPGRGGGRQAGRLHDHLSLDPWRVRGDGARGLPHHPRARRSGLYRRRQHERDGRAGAARRSGRRCQPPEPAQDLLHSAWRRRPRHGADRGQGASGAASARPSGHRRAGGAGVGRALWQRLDPADLLGLLPDDGRRGADPGDAGGDPQRQLHRRAAEGRLPVAVLGPQGPGGA